jgi:hypothetical protein
LLNGRPLCFEQISRRNLCDVEQDRGKKRKLEAVSGNASEYDREWRFAATMVRLARQTEFATLGVDRICD